MLLCIYLFVLEGQNNWDLNEDVLHIWVILAWVRGGGADKLKIRIKQTEILMQ